MIILLYSAKKNMAKMIEEYSTLYPATNSASASGRSKGVRFVSAIIEMKKIKEIGARGKINQAVFCCKSTISTKFNEPAIATTGRITRLIATS